MTRSAYGYVYGNPLNGTDPSGLYCFTGVKGHREDGSEICNGASEIVDNVVPDNLRPPDYVTFDGGFKWPLGSLPIGGGGGLNFTFSKSGGVFIGPEGGVGTPGPFGTAKMGWLNRIHKPCDDDIDSFLEGWFGNAGGGSGLQGGETVNTSGDTATELGVGSPGAGAMGGYSWHIFDLPFGFGY